MNTKIMMLALIFGVISGRCLGQEITPSLTQAEADSIDSLYKDLDDLVVTAQENVVRSDGAKLTYDVDQDNTSKGRSVLDALRKVPMVTVDGNDKIYIKGDSNFRIYVNGKEDPMLTSNYSTALKAMPAESVSKIEVITEPGARYDAEGTGGVLNLVTQRKQTSDGYAGSVNVSFGAQNTSTSLYGRMKYGNVTADAGVDYANNSFQHQSSTTNEEVIDHTNDEMHRMTTQTTQRISFDYVGARLNISWEPTKHDLFTAGGSLTFIDADICHMDVYSAMYDIHGRQKWSYEQNLGGMLRNLGVNANTSYRHLFGDETHSLTASYQFSYAANPLDIDYHTTQRNNLSTLPTYKRNETDSYDREHTVKVDYSNPLGSSGDHSLDVGIKGIFRHNTARGMVYTGEKSEEMAFIASESNLTGMDQDIYAIYAAYDGTFSNCWNIKAGIRYEHTRMAMDFRMGDTPDFSSHLNDVVPDVALTYVLGPSTNLRLAYNMRISRPSLNQMNPFKLRFTENSILVGNPKLTSERYNRVSITYSNYGRLFGGNVALEYFQSNNTIESYSYYEGITEINTYGNFGHNRRATLSGFLNWNITPKMSLSINGSVFYNIIKSGDGTLGNDGWNGQYGANWSYTGPWKLKFSAYGGQSTGAITLQGSDGGWYYYGLGISKDFLKEDALNIAINANNFFTKYTDYRSITDTGTHMERSVSESRSWNVGVSLTWKFGKLKDQVKSTGADLDNDDIKKSGNKTGIGL